MDLQARIDQLKEQKALLQMQLDELNFLIMGYENTLKAQSEKEAPSEG